MPTMPRWAARGRSGNASASSLLSAFFDGRTRRRLLGRRLGDGDGSDDLDGLLFGLGPKVGRNSEGVERQLRQRLAEPDGQSVGTTDVPLRRLRSRVPGRLLDARLRVTTSRHPRDAGGPKVVERDGAVVSVLRKS